jgi:UDP-glucose-4-epimerase GalE
MTSTILVSGGAGYIGSHAAYALRAAGYQPVVIDNLSHGHAWAAGFGPFEKGDIGDADFIKAVCAKYRPNAAMHFAALIEVAESMREPARYMLNNRDKAVRFFTTLQECAVTRVVFSSTAAVYGDVQDQVAITENAATQPINPYGQSKLQAESFLRSLDGGGFRSVTLRYFNVAGAAPAEVQIGEAHRPETHLIPRIVLPLIDTPPELLQKLGLAQGFTMYGDDYPTPDGTAVRDYLHVMDLVEAHILALRYLDNGGTTAIFNLGSGEGFSVKQIVEATRVALGRPDFQPGLAPRRAGDPAFLVASHESAKQILGWQPQRSLPEIIRDAAAWHRSTRYRDAMSAA